MFFPTKKIVSLFSSLAISLCFSTPANAAAAEAIKTLHSFLDGTKSLRADFSQIVVAKNGKKPQASSGVMMFSKPGKFRWQIERPYSQLLVGDGEKIWIFDPDLKQVTVKKMGEALGNTPAAILIGKEALEKNFTLKEAGTREEQSWVEAIPKSTESGFEKINIGFLGKELRSMELFDNFGQTTMLTFMRVEKNIALPASIFTFTPPADVDVIGE